MTDYETEMESQTEQMDGCQGEEWDGEGWIGSLELVDADYLEWINNEVLRELCSVSCDKL